ncbi:unnamed protein product [Gordionus sp. m RMFG-2023]
MKRAMTREQTGAPKRSRRNVPSKIKKRGPFNLFRRIKEKIDKIRRAHSGKPQVNPNVSVTAPAETWYWDYENIGSQRPPISNEELEERSLAYDLAMKQQNYETDKPDANINVNMYAADYKLFNEISSADMERYKVNETGNAIELSKANKNAFRAWDELEASSKSVGSNLSVKNKHLEKVKGTPELTGYVWKRSNSYFEPLTPELWPESQPVLTKTNTKPRNIDKAKLIDSDVNMSRIVETIKNLKTRTLPADTMLNDKTNIDQACLDKDENSIRVHSRHHHHRIKKINNQPECELRFKDVPENSILNNENIGANKERIDESFIRSNSSSINSAIHPPFFLTELGQEEALNNETKANLGKVNNLDVKQEDKRKRSKVRKSKTYKDKNKNNNNNNKSGEDSNSWSPERLSCNTYDLPNYAEITEKSNPKKGNNIFNSICGCCKTCSCFLWPKKQVKQEKIPDHNTMIEEINENDSFGEENKMNDDWLEQLTTVDDATNQIQPLHRVQRKRHSGKRQLDYVSPKTVLPTWNGIIERDPAIDDSWVESESGEHRIVITRPSDYDYRNSICWEPSVYYSWDTTHLMVPKPTFLNPTVYSLPP